MQREYSQQYLSLWQNHWWWQARHSLVLAEIKRLRQKNSQSDRPWRILDIGCGGGAGFQDYSQFGEVFGIEPDPELATALPEWSERIEQRCFDATYRPAEAFDLVLMLDVLEHLEHDEDALLAVQRVLRPGGFLLITVPALMSLWSVHDEMNQHFRRYTAANLRLLLQSTNYQIHKLHYFYSWSLPLMYLRKVLTKDQDGYSVSIPPWPLNGLFRRLSNVENSLHRRRLHLPLGSSLIALVQTRDSQS